MRFVGGCICDMGLSPHHTRSWQEIRYILDGSGYFDVRNLDDQWVRVAMEKGDLLVLPAGIYHRCVRVQC